MYNQNMNSILNQHVSLFIIRIYSGLFMLLFHGLPKLQNYSAISNRFADPFGLGPAFSLALVIFAEFFCALLILLGVAVRTAVIPLIITMLVAVFIIHGDDPMGKKELAISYLFCYLALFFGGGGNISVNIRKWLPKHWLFN